MQLSDVLDLSDPLHCQALLNTGSWLDNAHKIWQPEGVHDLPCDSPR
jgi:hypothetical protein